MSGALNLQRPDSELISSATVSVGTTCERDLFRSTKACRVAFNSRPERMLKRSFDVTIAALALILLAPLFLLIALGIRLEGPGPVFFRQRRGGVHGKTFYILKFRTMRHNPNPVRCIQATRKDRRVTSIGRFLRKTSLDELPQLINVVKGDMSIVGPRPHAIQHDQEYSTLIPSYHLRYLVKPGITGWAQVNQCRGETETIQKMSDRVQHDIYYVQNGSFWLDIKILARTPLVLCGANVY